MPLLPRLRAEAERRGLLAAGSGPPSLARIFELVRDMPYARTPSPEPEVTIGEWRGTCSGKHYLLRALIEEFGLGTILVACTHEFTPQNSPWLPPELLAYVRERPVPDVHNFLRVETGAGWMTVDATWPLAAARLGLPVNERWVDGRDMRVACDPIELFHVPDDADPHAFKQALIEREVGDQAERRERFIEALSAWLAEGIEREAGRPAH